MKHVIFASYGNDSIALLQWAKERDLDDVTVVYSNTGWAADWWADRVHEAEQWALKSGFRCVEIQSEGMIPLVKRKKGWPMGGGGAFCTAELKVIPALKWLDNNDPGEESTCVIGVRREESANRAQFPEWTEESEKHGGRSLWAPLVRVGEEERDALIRRAGFEPLPHRSMECFPCVHANINDLRMLTEDRIELIDITEQEMGYNSKGNYRAMFRPKRHKGAVGIRAVVDWARAPRARDQKDLLACDSGWCGS